MNLIICDFFSNLIELYVRMQWKLFDSELSIVGMIFMIAIARTTIICIIIVALQYHKILILQQDHENRYRKLLWITSQLKTEMYWMEKNMDHIENVMSNAYSLFENISNDECRDEWADMSVNIARDVHEIKKEYGLIFRGIEEVIDNKLHDSGMNFKDVVKILKDSMLIQASSEGDNISLEFNISENFYTDKHYQLMSIFRNLIMNSMEAIGPRDNGKIVFRHTTDSENHIFSICDNGCGIKTEDSENIFSAGFSTKINYETGQINRGLGLSLVKDIVEKQLGGKIEVNSKHSQGTEFNITILKQILNV
ncbi:ATP-binding protein [Peptoclostridium litorale]|nr:ATP-binding protein [Peptoclostridium litorale]